MRSPLQIPGATYDSGADLTAQAPTGAAHRASFTPTEAGRRDVRFLPAATESETAPTDRREVGGDDRLIHHFPERHKGCRGSHAGGVKGLNPLGFRRSRPLTPSRMTRQSPRATSWISFGEPTMVYGGP